MRQIVTNVYEFRELSEKARRKAMENVSIKYSYELTECDLDEIWREIKCLCETIGARESYSGECLRICLKYPQDELEDMKDGMLRFIERNELKEWEEYRNRSGSKRYSHVSWRSRLSSPEWLHLAGAIDKVWDKRYEYVRRGEGVERFLRDLAYEIQSYADGVVEDCHSDYYVSDFIECMGMEFHEDGSLA